MEDRQSLVVSKTRELSAIQAAESAKAIIQAAYTMAAARPRNRQEIRQKFKDICKNAEFADAAFYKPRPVGGGKKVQDFSIRFAEEVHTQWQNLWVKVSVLYDDDDIRKIQVDTIDLEANSCSSEEFVIPKIVEKKSKEGREEDLLGERLNSYGETVYLLRATEDEVDRMVGARRSKIKRNLILGLIPADLKNELRALVRATRANQVKDDPIAWRKKWIDAFARIGVPVTEMERFLGKRLDDATMDEWDDLIGVYNEIRDGNSKWADHCERPEATKTTLRPEDLRPGKPEDHTPVDIPLTSGEETEVGKPQSATPTIMSCVDIYLAYCDENDMGEGNSENLAKEIKKKFGKPINQLPDELGGELDQWLRSRGGK